ncbi:Holliday junction resolvase RecU (plasmid) [Exiguobacterium sp. PFWT01]|uniref:Holliday junction resolvase RecU n=1 Tax=Exiguobacterium sp. PFWT01 TaxID=2829816 RepID=UPI001BA55178|nr:Holliday junction resolvase RecU [Exiguobacterium sp. PFWT01]QUP88700.1 Holliday junction resolvase RecU [Exiguobacterium sp. PFWT01]
MSGIKPLQPIMQSPLREMQPLKKAGQAFKGMVLERKIEQSNMQLQLMGEVEVFKRPTEKVKVGDKIKYKSKSGVDFNGVIKGGKGVAFDAKETEVETNFPLKNVKLHQYETLLRVDKLGGWAFLVVHFVSLNESYLLKASFLKEHWKGVTSKYVGKGSIPIGAIRENCVRIKMKNGCHLDWVSAYRESENQKAK